MDDIYLDGSAFPKMTSCRAKMGRWLLEGSTSIAHGLRDFTKPMAMAMVFSSMLDAKELSFKTM